VAVFGVGGVGGFACEALARSGIGNIDIFDKDVVSLSNINRQIIALHSTVGRAKVDVMKERISDINPDCKVNAHCVFYLPDNAEEYDLSKYDYIVDAVDTVSAKAEIICRATRLGVPVISTMGAGNKIDPTKFKVADIYKTEGCPLARVMRRELKKRGIEKLKVVYSPESPQRAIDGEGEERVPGSLSFVPSVMGLIIAGEVIKDIVK
jgi:tRNA A37 threonylcarbamoyladenosine dehydratase